MRQCITQHVQGRGGCTTEKSGALQKKGDTLQRTGIRNLQTGTRNLNKNHCYFGPHKPPGLT